MRSRCTPIAGPLFLLAAPAACLAQSVFHSGFEPSVFIGADAQLLEQHGGVPAPDAHGASFRIKCTFSHANYDDAIVYPGQVDRAHLHVYMGNTGADAHSTASSLMSSGDSTCQGGRLNRSAYWIPAVLAPRFDASGNALFGEDGLPQFSVVTPTSIGFAGSQPDIYYKSDVDDFENIQPMPTGLRMISGNGRAGPTAPQPPEVIRWWCESTVIMSSDDVSPHIPACAVGDLVNFIVAFPSCWDGVNLDSPDHSSHMSRPEAVPQAGGGFFITCPDSHPVRLPVVSYNMAFPVTAENAGPDGTSARWRIASDMYDTQLHPGGYSAHGDWFMAWEPEVISTWTRHCLQSGRDCNNGDLGNGWRLLGPFTGPGTIPEVIRCGMGPAGDAMHC